jgi:hypothetical protein
VNVYILFNESAPVEVFANKHDAYREKNRLELEGRFNRLAVKDFLLIGYEPPQCNHSHLTWDFPRRN